MSLFRVALSRVVRDAAEGITGRPVAVVQYRWLRGTATVIALHEKGGESVFLVKKSAKEGTPEHTLAMALS